jgi:hypothetical protein
MFIPLTKSHNETHYVAKTKKNKKQDKTAPMGFALSV